MVARILIREQRKNIAGKITPLALRPLIKLITIYVERSMSKNGCTHNDQRTTKKYSRQNNTTELKTFDQTHYYIC